MHRVVGLRMFALACKVHSCRDRLTVTILLNNRNVAVAFDNHGDPVVWVLVRAHSYLDPLLAAGIFRNIV